MVRPRPDGARAGPSPRRWTLTQYSGLDGALAARAGSSRPEQLPPTRHADGLRQRPARAARRARDGRLPRAARGPHRRRPARSCAWGSTPIPARCPTGFSRDLRGHRGVRAGSSSRRPRRLPRGQAQPRVLRGVRVGRASPRSSGSGRAVPADVPVVADAKRGDIGSTAARQAVALFDGLGADAVTVSPYLGSEAIAPAARADRPVRLRAVPDVEPGRRRAPGPRRSRPSRRPARPRSRSTPGSPGSRRAGVPAGPSGSSSGRRRPVELAAIRAIAPGLALLVPGVGAQGGDVGPVLAAGPATAAPAGGRPGGGLLVNVSRGIAGAADRDGNDGPPSDPASASRRPPANGPSASLCYRRPPVRRGSRTAKEQRARDANIPDRSSSSSSS